MWEDLIASFPTGLQGKVRATIDGLRQRNAVNSIQDLVQLDPAKLAQMIAAATGDDPATDRDDAIRSTLARTLIAAAAKSLAPQSTTIEPVPAINLAGTKLGDRLVKQQAALVKSGIRSWGDLRKAARTPQALKDAGFDAEDISTLAEFAALARVFPNQVALALHTSGAADMTAVARMSEQDFSAALTRAGLQRDVIEIEKARLARLKKRVAGGGDPKAVTGLALDADQIVPLTTKERTDIGKADIETLTDWAAAGHTIAVQPDTKRKLDAMARLTPLGFPPDIVPSLVANGIESATELSLLDSKRQAMLTRATGTPAAVFTRALALAFQYSQEAKALFPDALRWQDLRDKLQDAGLLPGFSNQCIDCAENVSVISKYAYFLYLIQKTGLATQVLETVLLQSFSRLSPADGEKEVTQIQICNEVLTKALNRPLTDLERMPYARGRLVAALRTTLLSAAQLATMAGARRPGINVVDLEDRLQQALDLSLTGGLEDDLLKPQPAFTNQEGLVLEGVIRAHWAEQVRQDPQLSGASPTEIAREANRRASESEREEMQRTQVVLRAILKRLLGLSDQRLFRRYFIETDLAACEVTTRLDQAIRTLQAYLDAWTTGASLYLNYPMWRGEQLGEIYPELALLLQDDVLVRDSAARDRGSILLDHGLQREKLREELDKVRQALREARVSVGDQHPSEADFQTKLSLLKNEVFYSDFQRGVAMISDILEANDEIVDSSKMMDQDEPGIALAKLQKALGLLDQVDSRLFDASPFWTNQLSAGKRYDLLSKLPTVERKQRLENAFFEFVGARKAIFESQQVAQTVEGINDNTVLRADHPAWDKSTEFIQRNETLVRRQPRSSRLSQFRYAHGQSLQDYSFGCAFVARSYWTPEQEGTPKVGVGFRLQPSGISQLVGYRLVILEEWDVIGSGDDARQVRKEKLALQAVDQGGRVSTLSEELIGTSSRTDIEARNITINHEYILQITVTGSRLTGELRVTPEWSHTITADNAAFAKGTISVFVNGTAEVEFSDFFFHDEDSVGFAPFYAVRRQGAGFRIDDTLYWGHREYGSPMSTKIGFRPLTSHTSTINGIPMAGVKRQGNDVYLVFGANSNQVDLDRLDMLLDQCLILTYYMRFAIIPVRMAQAYVELGEFPSAAAMLKLLYDDSIGQPEARLIYPFLVGRYYSVDPDQGVDARSLRLRLGEIYLRWAEFLFRQDTESAKYEARRLCERVVRLHDADDCRCYKNHSEAVSRVANAVYASPRDRQDRSLASRLPLLSQVMSPSAQANADDVLAAQDLDEIAKKLAESRARSAEQLAALTLSKLADAGHRTLQQIELAAQALDTRRSLIQSHTRLAPARLPVRTLYTSSATPRIAAQFALCVPENPVLVQQVQAACQMLELLRTCRNILGFGDYLVPELRFEALVRIAQNFANLAQQAERDVLIFRQNMEQEAFSLMDAKAKTEQANAEVAIEELHVTLAEGDIALAELQFDQVQSAVEHFDALVKEGFSQTERVALSAAENAAALAWLSAYYGVASEAAKSAFGVVTALASGGTMSPSSMLAAGSSLASFSDAFSKQFSALSYRAGLERQQQDREFQLEQGRWGLAIAHQNRGQAVLRWKIAQAQQNLAQLRRQFSFDAFQFLSNKFLSAATWLYLMRTARDQYRRRLNYAISAAHLAERALAFELQDKALRVIRFDYFDPRRDGLLGGTQLQTDLATLENLKLTHTKRKLQLSKTISLAQVMPVDLELFRNGATLPDGTQLLPGRLPLSTLMEWFDQDFPGHYMRLITSVKVTVVALVPPTAGIRAMLRNSGVSRVVVGPPYAPSFREQVIQRNPEAIALSAPYQASGLFVLDYRDDLLLPFEGSGVASDWVFEMPKAANPFDYDTIADVQITIEYTALESGVYRSQVIQQLDTRVQAERLVSLKNEFPDVWYDLHYPDRVEDANRRMKAIVEITSGDFPPSLTRLSGQHRRVPDVKIEHLQLYVVRNENEKFEMPVKLKLKPAIEVEIDAGSATTNGGLISTRQSSGGSWRAQVQGKLPVGKWEFDFTGDATHLDEQGQPVTYPISDFFDDDRVEDILLIITYTGRLPDRP